MEELEPKLEIEEVEDIEVEGEAVMKAEFLISELGTYLYTYLGSWGLLQFHPQYWYLQNSF